MSDIDFNLTPVGNKKRKETAEQVSRDKINVKIQPTPKKLYAHEDENRELEKTLWARALPRLMSGEIRLRVEDDD